jgi:hypothetical protein
MYRSDEISSSIWAHWRVLEVEKQEVEPDVGRESRNIAAQNGHAASNKSLPYKQATNQSVRSEGHTGLLTLLQCRTKVWWLIKAHRSIRSHLDLRGRYHRQSIELRNGMVSTASHFERLSVDVKVLMTFGSLLCG